MTVGTCSPFGFLERFDPDYTPNTTDMDGMRYTYGRQPTIGQWNLAQLAQALLLAELIEQVSTSTAPRLCLSWFTCSFHVCRLRASAVCSGAAAQHDPQASLSMAAAC